ncbi:MAG: hypothetical protein F6J93_12275 [Oscillatoria sp. SIO1A7]|nr:hypothetical protein [Oscillatoria sp. SIO1A7]
MNEKNRKAAPDYDEVESGASQANALISSTTSIRELTKWTMEATLLATIVGFVGLAVAAYKDVRPNFYMSHSVYIVRIIPKKEKPPKT